MNSDRLLYKLQRGLKLDVLFVNDFGFQYGAGIAHLRQIQSFLLLGHTVRGLCWTQGAKDGAIPVVPEKAEGKWLGMRQFPNLHRKNGCSNSVIVTTVLHEVEATHPDIVVVGNIHGSRWPLELLPAIRSHGAFVIAYMHDCFYITGRCVYPFDCTLYQRGCNDECLTWDQYPQLSKDKIRDAWVHRQDIFSNYPGIALAANSLWTLGMAKNAIHAPNYADVVYLGLDHNLFRPIDRSLSRRLLGLPDDAFVIVAGAMKVNDPRKGFHLFKEIISKLSPKVSFLVFGAETPRLEGVTATGLIRDYRKMPLLYSAANLFIGTSVAESFGQTFCEAAACGIPIVAFRSGGIPEVARHNVNARLVDEMDITKFLEQIEFFMQNPFEREVYGSAGRAMVEAEFTLQKQSERWEHYLKEMVAS